jgi:hypothetical protein
MKDFLGSTLGPQNRPAASSKLFSSLWRRRSLSRSFKASRPSRALAAGIIAPAGVSGLLDQARPGQPGQQRQEKEQARPARPQAPSRRQFQQAGIGHLGRQGACR